MLDLNTTAATDKSDQLSTSLQGDRENALAREDERDETVELGAEQGVDGASEETGEVTNKAGVDVERDLRGGFNALGQPVNKETLKLSGKVALGAGEPKGEFDTVSKFNVDREASVGTEVKKVHNLNIDVKGVVSLEESSEGSLSTAN